MKRQTVFDRGPSLDLYELLDMQTFDGAVLKLQQEKEIWHKDLKYADAVSIKLIVDSMGYDGGVECYLQIERWETDREFEARKEHAAKAKRAAQERKRKAEESARAVLLATEAQEKALFEKLRAKYGDPK